MDDLSTCESTTCDTVVTHFFIPLSINLSRHPLRSPVQLEESSRRKRFKRWGSEYKLGGLE